MTLKKYFKPYKHGQSRVLRWISKPLYSDTHRIYNLLICHKIIRETYNIIQTMTAQIKSASLTQQKTNKTLKNRQVGHNDH